MKKIKKFYVSKKKIKDNVVFDNYNVEGYHIKPRNKMDYDGIVVNSMTIYNCDLIQSLLKKKIKKKLDVYTQFMISVLDDDDTDAGHLMFALNDLDRYRHLVMNNYRVYLEKKYLKILMDKMELIEQELRSKIRVDLNDMIQQMEMDFEEPQKGRSR